MQRAFERADGAGDGGVHVGQGGGDDAGGEGAGVELVVGVEDERDVEGAGGGVGGLFAVEHPEEVGGVREGAVGFDDGLAFADAVEDGDDHGDLRGEAEALAEVGVVRASLSRRRRRWRAGETAVRRTSMGEALVGTLRRRSMTSGSSLRAAARWVVKSASSAAVGSLPYQRR